MPDEGTNTITVTIDSDAALSLISENTITADASLLGLEVAEQAAYDVCEAAMAQYGAAWVGDDLEKQDALWDQLISATCDDPCNPDGLRQEYMRSALKVNCEIPSMISALQALDISQFPEDFPGLSAQVGNQVVYCHQQSWPYILQSVSAPYMLEKWPLLMAVWAACTPLIVEA